MNRRDWYLSQVVGEGDLDDLEARIEEADAHGLDAFSLGGFPVRGLAPSPDGTLILPIGSGIGIATDADGDPRFVKLGSPSTIHVADAVPAGSAKWVAVCLHFVRALSGAETDGANATVYTVQAESSELVLIEGTEGGGKPAIPTDHVPIVDLQLQVGQTGLTAADLDFSRTKPAWAKSTGGVAQQLADVAAPQLDNARPMVRAPQRVYPMQVTVRPGAFHLADQLVSIAGGNVTIPASPTPNRHRITLVYADTAGALQLAHGAEVTYVTDAVPPSFEGRYPIAIYDVLDTTTTLAPASLVDVRPFARMAREVPNRYRHVAADGDTAVTISGWTFVVGAHALSVFKNGLLLSETAYTEKANGTGIEGLAALLGGKAGAGASISSSGDLATLTGMAGLTPAHVGRTIVVSAATTSGHNGTFQILEYVSATSAKIANAANAGADANNGAIAWAVPGDIVELVAARVAGTNPVLAHAAAHAADGSDPISYAALDGFVVPGVEISNASNGFEVNILPFSAVIGGRLRTSPTLQTVDLSSLVPSAGLKFLYAYWTGSVFDFEVSATEPDDGGRFKLNDTSRILLCPLSIVTGGSGYARKFSCRNRTVRFIPDYAAAAVDPTSVNGKPVAAITGTHVAQTIDLSAVVPAYVEHARMGFAFTGAAAGKLLTVAGVGGLGPNTVMTAPSTHRMLAEFEVYLGGAQAIQMTNDDDASASQAWVSSFSF